MEFAFFCGHRDFALEIFLYSDIVYTGSSSGKQINRKDRAMETANQTAQNGPTTEVDNSCATGACPLVRAAASPRWNAYIVGAGIGVLSWVAFAVVAKPLGVSTAVSSAAGAAAIPFVGSEAVQANAYWAKHFPKWDYGMLFLVGTFLGALISSVVSRSFKLETVPTVWQERFGPSRLKRFVGAFIGGVLILFGARLAGGCTSGHGISGSLQLAVSSWVFFLTMFVFGVITAWIMFRRPAGRAA
jgi:uncharacterized membrane protein YedE/YeeE